MDLSPHDKQFLIELLEGLTVNPANPASIETVKKVQRILVWLRPAPKTEAPQEAKAVPAVPAEA